MNDICDKLKCSGCSACLNVCPHKAINMKEDELGFNYPIIDKKKCVECGLCKKICPVLNSKSNDSLNKCYACYSKEKDIKTSTSGGIFTLIAKQILKHKGLVVGAKLDNLKLSHTIISQEKDLKYLRGSKYIQSDLKEIFKTIKENLKSKEVLFVGTPCQVAGLKKYLNKEYDNLYCIDLICHGVPSNKILNKYLYELSRENNKEVENIDFRNKITGWEDYSVLIKFKDGTTISERHNDNIYINLFVSDLFLRYSCYNCNFKLGNKYSDITLGDYWGIKEVLKDMYNEDGVSALIINTSKGRKLFDLIKEDMVYIDSDIEDIKKYNYSISQSQVMPIRRKIISSYLNKKSLKELKSLKDKELNMIEKIKLKIHK